MRTKLSRLVFIAFVTCFSAANAETVRVAVAANFVGTASALASDFERITGNRVLISSAATGKLYAQVRAGAPFEVLLAADSETPERLVAEKYAVAGSQFTYAIGALALWSANPGVVDSAGKVLQNGHYRHLALANPRTAPYGAAAMETLRRMGLDSQLSARLVMGENIAQTYQFVASGNAEVGFVALAQVWRDGKFSTGSGWRVPAAMHTALRQDAVLLQRGVDNPSAQAFLAFIVSPSARTRIAAEGYGLP